MNIVTLYPHRRLFQLFYVLVFLVVASIGIVASTPRAHAATCPIESVPISGYAWSQYLGAINFSGSTYGVCENTTTGVLSGYAWVQGQDYLGWVTFNSDQLISCPTAPNCDAEVDVKNGGRITGWARACAAYSDTDPTAAWNQNLCNPAFDILDPGSGGWDGWIHLSGTAEDGTTYGWVQDTTCAWQNYAWGSENIGAIHATGTAQDVTAGIGSPFSAQISNIGDAATGSGFTNLFQVAADSSGTRAAFAGTDPSSALAARSSGTSGLRSYTFNNPGIYYMRACADKSSAGNVGVITEAPPQANEENNCGEWTRIDVTAPIAMPPPGPGAHIYAEPTRVPKDSTTVITWESSNTTSCSITNNRTDTTWSGTMNMNPGETSDPITAQTIFRINCTGSDGTTASDEVTVNILPAFKEF